ncbi:MAG: tRNA pseudouridine55 synthase, partial [Actinomycetota bacterium]|nr:tRNA pseudouridine55 synthase [Actinomycetota bacterium]
MTDGLLVIDKPAGMTSHDVVDVIRKRFNTKKVGHAGTLDPDATGILLLGVGKATRFLAYAQASPKRYRALARFGTSTSTQDASGEVLETRPCSFTRDELALALEKFTGDIEQVPPMVSAVKIGGEPLHAKARRGEEV